MSAPVRLRCLGLARPRRISLRPHKSDRLALTSMAHHHRLSSAIAAGSSLFLNAGTAVVLWSYHRSVEQDGDDSDAVLTFSSVAIAQACSIEAIVASVGLVGVLQVCFMHTLIAPVERAIARRYERGRTRPRGGR